MGFARAEFQDNPDLFVINTCSVTEQADKKCKKVVREAKKVNPSSTVVIIGCYAQLKPAEILAIPGVDLVLGANEKFQLPELLPPYLNRVSADLPKLIASEIRYDLDYHASYSVNDRTRTFLKVQDGCDYNCSFCTIPLARGHSRSDSIENVIVKAKEIAAQGVKEIVLTGINLGDFGKGNEGGKQREENFYDLIQELDKVEGIERYRISSIEPNLLSEEIIQFVAASKKFMPHFHIPLQSGSNKTLAAMRRRYKRELYAERVAMVKALMSHAAIGVDVIVGFPGETKEDFQETFDFLHSLDVSYFHVFTYSERANTLAIDLKPVVPMHERNERNKILRNLSVQKLNYFSNQFIDTTRKVLFENADKNGMMEGYTDNYIKVQTPHRAEWANEIVDWVLR
jgi:threonylcarbamoyladenosine tRNA methylthiotransferase MtaB